MSRDLAALEAKSESWTRRLEEHSQPHRLGGSDVYGCGRPAQSPFYFSFSISVYLLYFLPPKWPYVWAITGIYQSETASQCAVPGFSHVRFIYHTCFLVLLFPENSKLIVRQEKTA